MDSLENFGSAITLKERVYQVLKREIILGKVKPGERLNILDLSNKMNISGAPVREALTMLSKDGLVELEPHKRPVVAGGSPEDYEVSIDLRKMLEPYAARISVQNIPQSAIERVRRQLLDVLENPTDLGAYVDSDMAVHELFHTYAGSKVLSDTLNSIKAYTMRYRYIIEKHPDETQDNQTLRQAITLSTQEHLSVLQALESRDPERAYEAVMRHLDAYAQRNRPD